MAWSISNVLHNLTQRLTNFYFGQNQDETSEEESEHTPTLSQSILSSSDSVDMLEQSDDEKPCSGLSQKQDSKGTSMQLYETEVPINAPQIFHVTSESVQLQWKRSSHRHEVEFYEIRYKEVKQTKWTSYCHKNVSCSATVTGLKCSTKYHFKVRAVFNDDEGPYTDISRTVETKPSLGLELLKRATKQDNNNPTKYTLQIIETTANEKPRTRKCVVGQSNRGKGSIEEKTIMLVGATGAGKSTLLDGMINYITNVAFNDDFRFTVVDLKDEEKQKIGNQAISQTEWITSYKIHPFDGERINYTINIIDTPGFGDSRGIQRDKVLVEQIRDFFCTKGENGIDSIDAVCFVAQAPQARLTKTQSYIFDSILSIFGKDIGSNIVVMITFADGNTPPVLTALDAGGVPYKEHFEFNNSALYARKTEKFAKMFWDMSRENFQIFFNHLLGMKTRSLSLTAEVLDQRKRLQQTVDGLAPQVNIGLAKLEEIRRHKIILKQHELEMKANKNFKFKDKKHKFRKTELAAGLHVTNCLKCHQTCHKNCKIPNDSDKSKCVAMDRNGYCTICKNKCYWDQHVNNGYKIEMYEEEYEGTYDGLLKKYKVSAKKVDKAKLLLQNMEKELDVIKEMVYKMIKDITACLNCLKRIALKPDPLDDVQYIEQLIEAEKMNKEEGFNERIHALTVIKNHAELTIKVHEGKFDPFAEQNKGPK